VPELRFTGDSHVDLVRQVRAWLASTDPGPERGRTAAEVVETSADLTKDALRLIAAAAPRPIAETDLVAKLTEMGHRVTDMGRDGALAGLESIASVTDGSVVRRATEAGAKVIYEMNSTVAKQLLKGIRRG
jgi:hypothetical protein